MGKLGVFDLQTEHFSDPLWLWAHSLPKIDLHRHLEGTLRLATLLELASDYDIQLPSYDASTLRPYVQMTEDSPDFQRFLEKFQVLRRFYTSKEAIQRITREAIADAAQDNVIYLELRFNPLALARLQDFPLEDVVAWVMAAADQGQRETGTRTCLILQIPREKSLDIADEIVDLAIANFGPLVRGIDLAGNEVDYPPSALPRRLPVRLRPACIRLPTPARRWARPVCRVLSVACILIVSGTVCGWLRTQLWFAWCANRTSLLRSVPPATCTRGLYVRSASTHWLIL